MESKDIIDILPLEVDSKELADKIIAENNFSEIKNLTYLFNLNQAKRNIVRVIKMNSILDKISDQMIERVEKHPGEFSNNDLLNYMNVVQSSIDRVNKSINMVDESPAIQLNQQVNVNIGDVNSDVLSKESRDKVAEAVKSIIDKMNLVNINNEVDNADTVPTIIE